MGWTDWRRGRSARPQREPALARPFSESCWVMNPGTTEPIQPAQVTVTGCQLHIAAAPLSEQVPAAQDVSRLAQIDIWDRDIDLLIVESAHTLAMTTFRFANVEAAQRFAAALTQSYRREAGEEFPPGWLQPHGPRPGTETGAHAPPAPSAEQSLRAPDE